MQFYTDLQDDADFSPLQEEIKQYRAMLDDHMLTDQQVARMQLATIVCRKSKKQPAGKMPEVNDVNP